MTIKLFPALATLLLAATIPAAASTGTLIVQVNDAAGAPIVDAVAYAEPASGQSLPKVQLPAQIEQKARRFAPVVTVVQTGTAISFPNHDSVRHQVYSFSPAKVFELKLYSGAGGEPIVFDKAGVVVVGCNIHDRMVAYIQIVDTPYFGKSDVAGKVSLENILPGKYHLKVWHPNLPTSTPPPEQLVTVADGNLNVALTLPIKILPPK